MSRLIRWAALCATIVLILAATLTPVEVHGPPAAGTESLFDLRGAADAVANVLLFVPLGAAAALLFGGIAPVLIGAGLSVAIELGQLVVPGRFPSPSDLVFNTLGTAVGTFLVRKSRAWLEPQGALRWQLPVAAALLAFGVTGPGSMLFAPSVPHLDLYGQWTAEFENLERYSGEVLGAEVGGMAIGSRRASSSLELRRALLSGDTLGVVIRAGQPPADLAPIFSIYDSRANEVALLGADGRDLVYRFRMRATDAHLDQPDIRVREAMGAVAPGMVGSLRVWREKRQHCVAVGSERTCGLGFTVGDTWSLLHYPIPGPLAASLPFIWLASLALPLGFWLRSTTAAAAAAVVLAVFLIAVPAAAGILHTPAPQIAAALAGVAIGHAAGRRIRRLLP